MTLNEEKEAIICFMNKLIIIMSINLLSKGSKVICLQKPVSSLNDSSLVTK